MEEILIISNYYPPEKGAAANRIEQLAHKLNENGYKVSVVCPLGNYPEGRLFDEYKGKFSVTEIRENITVKRLWVYPSVSKNILIRLLSVASFIMSLFFYLLIRKTPKKIIVQSPPLLLSFVSVGILSLKNKKIILNVSDLWPLAAIELKAIKERSISHRFSLFFERLIYKKATLILGQSNEIIEHIKSKFPNKDCYLYRNFPEHNVSKLTLVTENQPTIKIFYAGLLGIAQGVLELCERINLDGLPIELHIYGDGSEKNKIEQFLSKGKKPYIHFHGMLNRSELHQRISTYDIAIVPLKTRIYGSVPSKIFEYGCLGFPILYFGGGEGETIVNETQLGWVASVGDYEDLNTKLHLISKLSKSELKEMKSLIFNNCHEAFDLKKQMLHLISEGVF